MLMHTHTGVITCWLIGRLLRLDDTSGFHRPERQRLHVRETGDFSLSRRYFPTPL